MQYIKSNDGIKTAVYDYNPKGKRTVFLIHGWPLSHKIYEYQISLLTNCGFRVVAVDLRGFGKSDTPACGYTYNQMSADIFSVVQILKLRILEAVNSSVERNVKMRVAFLLMSVSRESCINVCN